MSGSRPSPPLQPSFRQRLLPTPLELVPTEYVDVLRSFCATVPEIEAAYICAVENTREDAEPMRALRFSVQVSSPVSDPEDARAELDEIAGRLAESHPEVMRVLGCGLLATRAVPAWQQYALRVFP